MSRPPALFAIAARLRLTLLVVSNLVLHAACARPAAAEIPEYMIRRLLYLGTSCGVESLYRLESGADNLQRFRAECRDVQSYPAGIWISCTDISDDRSCKIETSPRTFDSLDLMRPKEEDD